MMNGFPFYRMNGLLGSWNWLGMLICIAIIISIVIGVIVLLSRSSKKTQNKGSNASLEILKDRLARGEINQEEYEKIRKDLF